MVDTNELENFLNEKTAKAGDIVEILGEGEIKKGQVTKFGVRDILNVPTRINGKDIVWSPSKNARNLMNKLCKTTDTKGWVGKKFSVVIVDNKLIPGNLIEAQKVA